MPQLLINAVNIAKIAHKNQYRNNGLEPYINHCLRTSQLIEDKFPLYANEEVLASAILHDSLEDCDESLMPKVYESIYKGCGEKVAAYVDLLTKPRDFSFMRNKRYKARLLNAPKEVIIIKIADRIDNLMDIPQSGWEIPKVLWYIEDSVKIYDIACYHNAINESKLLIDTIMFTENYINGMDVT